MKKYPAALLFASTLTIGQTPPKAKLPNCSNLPPICAGGLISQHTITEQINAYIAKYGLTAPLTCRFQRPPRCGAFLFADPFLPRTAASQLAGTSACSSSTGAVSLPITYNSQPVIIVFDETTKGGANLSTKSTSGFTVSCTGASDAFDWMVIGNPN